MDCFVSEIRVFAGTYAPQNWHFCDGSLLQVSENQALFALIGTTYGGDGQATFAVPDLRGRLPIGFGKGTGLSNTYALGAKGGGDEVVLGVGDIPAHTHPLTVSSTVSTTGTPSPNVTFGAGTDPLRLYIDASKAATKMVNFSTQAIATSGESQPHDNLMPAVAMNYIICLVGQFPPQS